MVEKTLRLRISAALLCALATCLAATRAQASITAAAPSGPGTYTFTAKPDRITTPDGNSVYFWGLANGLARAQYPGPTVVVNQGDTVTISVTNQLPYGEKTSLTFPGQQGVTSTCAAQPCSAGVLAMEAGTGGTVTYSFTASKTGTFHYTSATRPDLQIEMGLVGALIVRPAAAGQAYASPDSAFDREYLFLLSEMDSHIHDLVETQNGDAVYKTKLLSSYFPNYWFINGRNAPDTMADQDGTSRFPTQPYSSLPKMHPGERLLMRVIGAGHDLHPFHHHGNHARVIAVDGNPLSSDGGLTMDLSHEVFTIQSVPGQTVDAIFTWTGKDLGWDAYGTPTTSGQFAHTCNGLDTASNGYDPVTNEWCGDHGKAIPVALPDQLSTSFGGFWSGSPYLGTLSLLPPGQGGLNPDAGFTYMWHSHTEKEITNFDIFPGGMMTMLVIVPRSTVITPTP
jgi:manganese oxidase